MIKTELDKNLQLALRKLDIPFTDEIQFSRTKDVKFGNVSTNLALLLAKTLRTNPRDLANRITENLEFNPDIISRVEVAGAGFINFFYSENYLFEQLKQMLLNPIFGRHKLNISQKANVEFVSANPTGPLSLGHGRQAVLGDVLCRLLENAGYDVTREYYFNNAGFQMKRLGESVRLRYLELLGQEVDFPEKHYEGEYIREIAASIHEEHGTTWENEPYTSFTAVAETILFGNIKKVLEKIDVHFDVYFNEDSLYHDGSIQKLVDAFRAREMVYEKDGATWLATSTFEYDHGQKPDTDKVIIKSTGEPTYRLPDMAYHANKFERKFDVIIDIFGADHIAEYPDVLAGLKAIGYDTSHVRVLIHQFVTLLKEGEVLKMSKRKANFVTIDELVDILGIDVFRYFLVMRSHHSHLNFDLELALKTTMENPVYYIQNAHARICSIETKALSRDFDCNNPTVADLTLLTAAEEKGIIEKLLEFPELTLRLATILEVHPLTTYLEELAALYHHYQTAGKKDDSLRVVTDNRELTKARLALCRATRLVLARGLGILGVNAPTYMAKGDVQED